MSKLSKITSLTFVLALVMPFLMLVILPNLFFYFFEYPFYRYYNVIIVPLTVWLTLYVMKK